jgi:hypothetical protein
MMDRSFLSQPEVIAASRNWVCIRLATYESASEARLLESIFVGRSGRLENTVFALLAPDGSTLLTRPGRSPQAVFADAAAMASGLSWLARGYHGRAAPPSELPRMSDYRLALDVAACDGLPLIVVTSAEAERALAAAAWSAQNLGRAVYVRDSFGGKSGTFLVVPDQFGLQAAKVQELPANLTAQELSQRLAPWRQPPKDGRAHMRAGISRGVRWQTRVPVTDPEGRY